VTEFKLSMINWMNCIWQSDLPSHSKLISAYLRSHMNDHHDMAWPSLSTIQAKTNLSRSTVVKYIDKLCSQGWLVRDCKSRNSTTYIATFPKYVENGLKVISNSTPDELAMLANSTPDELGSTPDELVLVRETYPNKQSNKQENKIDAPFDVFWENWREQKKRLGIENYGSKSDAKNKFVKLFCKKTDDELRVVVNSALCKLQIVVDDLLVKPDSQYFNYRNMYPQKFLGSEDWDSTDE
jgi:DNA-binding MarR family transcriptional regulator